MRMRKKDQSSFPTTLSCEEARKSLLEQTNEVTGYENLNIRSAINRILDKDLQCPVNVPLHTNSAMDGYAVKHADLSIDGNSQLNLVGTAYAGKPYKKTVENRTAVNIMTGAAMPQGTDTVIILEDVQRKDDKIIIKPGHTKGQNVRHAGEDLEMGAKCLRAGRRLTASDIGLVASLGITELRVRRRIKVAFFSTGDELKSLGETLDLGEIYDSNRYTLYGLLHDFGADIIDMGVVKDDPTLLATALKTASESADAIITSGGVSVGEADHIKSVLQSIGTIKFWKIMMKPGRPLAFGKIGSADFFGLPGNPISSAACFRFFIIPFLHSSMDVSGDNPIVAKIKNTFTKKKNFTRFIKGRVSFSNKGQAEFKIFKGQESYKINPFTKSNAWGFFPKGKTIFKKGTFIKCYTPTGINELFIK
mgnify:CR=1 FL=1